MAGLHMSQKGKIKEKSTDTSLNVKKVRTLQIYLQKNYRGYIEATETI
jgi:hypothetical protein